MQRNNAHEEYRTAKEELLRQIARAYEEKEKIDQAVKVIEQQRRDGLITEAGYNKSLQEIVGSHTRDSLCAVYDKHIAVCKEKLMWYEDKLAALPKTSSVAVRWIGICALLVLIIVSMWFVGPTLTGLVVADHNDTTAQYEAGYTQEGTSWADIKGDRLYRRCMRVTSDIDFNTVTIIGKVLSAQQDNGLLFALYDNNKMVTGGEPGEMIASCSVKDYASVVKSCTVENVEQKKGDYWLCAAHPGGSSTEVYYALAYQVGDSLRTALWTGSAWQKLEGSSYTMKGLFVGGKQ